MGKSASGKDKIYSRLAGNKELNLKKLILYTTRPVRDGEENGKQQLIYQLYKLPDVCSVKELTQANSLSCELMLIKLKNEPSSRDEIHAAAEAFKAETIDYTKESIVLRIIGDSTKMDDFIALMNEHTILEICRTGTASIEKGSATLRQNLNI